jgi:Ni/Co efflux regulator RcnB
MSQKFLACLFISMTVLASSSPALAQRDDRREGRQSERQQDRRVEKRSDRRDDRQDSRREVRDDNRREAIRRYDRLDDRGRGFDTHRNEWRGAGPNRNYYRGGRLPPQYNTRHYVVNDWRGHRLSAPPRGYHWVQSGSDYLLVAITTGIILQMLLD